MGLLNNMFGKKKEPSYDASDIRVTDLDRGFIFDYDLSTWEVKEVYDYDWGEGYFTREYKINNGKESLFLSVEEDDELEIIVSKKVKIRSIDEDLPEYISDKEKPPKKLEYKGVKYLLDGESPGYFRNAFEKSDNWIEFISWTYYDEEEGTVLCIEQWDDDEFEASVGRIVKEHEFSNILPTGE